MECREVFGDFCDFERVTCLLYTGQSRKLKSLLTSCSLFCSHVSTQPFPWHFYALEVRGYSLNKTQLSTK